MGNESSQLVKAAVEISKNSTGVAVLHNSMQMMDSEGNSLVTEIEDPTPALVATPAPPPNGEVKVDPPTEENLWSNEPPTWFREDFGNMVLGAEENSSGDGKSSEVNQDQERNEEQSMPANSAEVKPASNEDTLQVFNATDLQSGKILGEGGFGRVLSGNLNGIPVAIKIFHNPLPIQEVHGKIGELVKLKHRNVVNLLGIVKTDTIDCPQVILELLREGNLLQYLSRREHTQDNTMLGKLAYDVADAVDYLHSQNIVHGNLAARNILVEKVSCKYKIYHNAKISDAGLIRFAEGSGGNYMRVPNGKVLPIRWVPKELVDDDGSQADFTFATDTWSFGVLLWEIWSKGAVPYGAAYSNLRVMQFIQEGYSPLKIHRPSGCPDRVVGVMERIFKTEPSSRLSFSQIKNEFKSYRTYGLPNPWMLAMYYHEDQKLKNKQIQDKKIEQIRTTGKVENNVVDDEIANKSEQLQVAEDKLTANDAKPKRKRGGKKHRKKNSAPPDSEAGASGGGIGKDMSFDNSNVTMPHGFNPKESFPRRDPPYSSPSQAPVGDLRERIKLSKQQKHDAKTTTVPPQPPRGGGAAGSVNPNSKGKYLGKNVPPRFSGNSAGHSPSAEGFNLPSSQSVMMVPPPPYTPTPPAYSVSPSHTTMPQYEENYGASSNSRPGPSPSSSLNHNHDRNLGDSEESLDYRNKIKQLESQIEALKTEKITTDLLKNSAEFAALMKEMTEQRFTVLGTRDGPPTRRGAVGGGGGGGQHLERGYRPERVVSYTNYDPGMGPAPGPDYGRPEPDYENWTERNGRYGQQNHNNQNQKPYGRNPNRGYPGGRGGRGGGGGDGPDYSSGYYTRGSRY